MAVPLLILALMPVLAGQQKVNPNSPITVQEAESVFDRINDELFKAEGQKPLKVEFFKGKPTDLVTRIQFVDALAKMEKLSEPYFVVEARDQYCDPKIIILPKAQKDKAVFLITRGFLAPSGTITAGPGTRVSLADAGDAIGYLVERWAEYTHKPSIIWTPDLQYSKFGD